MADSMTVTGQAMARLAYHYYNSRLWGASLQRTRSQLRGRRASSRRARPSRHHPKRRRLLQLSKNSRLKRSPRRERTCGTTSLRDTRSHPTCPPPISEASPLSTHMTMNDPPSSIKHSPNELTYHNILKPNFSQQTPFSFLTHMSDCQIFAYFQWDIFVWVYVFMFLSLIVVCMMDVWVRLEIILLMSQQPECHADQIKLCECHLCRYQSVSTHSYTPSDVGTPNSMAEFIKLLPIGFPLAIEQTVILHTRDDGSNEFHSYFSPPQEDRKKFGIFHQTLKSINSMPCQNVQVYFPNNQRILARFEAVHVKGVAYVQPYQHTPIIRIQYPGPLEAGLDSILREYVNKEIERVKGDTYKLNEEFLAWVYREYGEESFFYFLTELYARLFRALTSGQLRKAVFFWVAERSAKDMLTVQSKGGEREKYNAMQELGRPQRLPFRPKLVNMRGMHVHKMEKLFSFQEEYQSLIKKRIAASTKKTISAIKNKAYRGRLEVFRSKIQDVYKQEQKAIMSGIQQQKSFEFQVDSEKMARLLIPTLGPDQNLRQVLNDEETFKQVFFSKKKDRHFTTLPTLTRADFGQKNKPNITRRHSTKKNPQIQHTGSRVKRRYEKLLTTPSTHE